MKMLVFALLLVVPALAQRDSESKMTADRPGFSESTDLLSVGGVQIENGLRLSRDHTVVLHQPTLRIGVADWLEFRLGSENVVVRSPVGSGVAGIADLEPSVKFPLFTGSKGLNVSAVLRTTFPSGHGSQTTGGFQPGFDLIWDQELTDHLSLNGTWNLSRLKPDQFLWQRATSVSLNNSFGRHFEAFAEFYVVSPEERGAGHRWMSDVGITHVIGGHLMLDGSAGHSIHGLRDWFAAVGVSVRTRVPHR